MFLRAVFCVSAVCLPTLSPADEPQPAVAGAKADQILRSRLGWGAQGSTLMAELSSIQEHTGLGILLDRRVDPSLPVDVQLAPTRPVTLAKLLAPADTETTAIEFQRAIVVGPVAPMSRMLTLAALRREELTANRSKLPRGTYAALSRARPVSWEALQEPRELLIHLAEASQVTVQNAERIPHDLWRGAVLPPMAFSDSATLILNQFDLTFSWDFTGQSIQIEQVPDRVGVQRPYRVSDAGRTAFREKWQQMSASAELTETATGFDVVALVEQHDEFSGRRTTGTDAAPPGSIRESRWTLTTDRAPVTYSQVIARLREGGVTIEFDAAALGEADIDLESMTVIRLESLKGDEFFPRLFRGLPLVVEVTDTVVKLTPR